MTTVMIFQKMSIKVARAPPKPTTKRASTTINPSITLVRNFKDFFFREFFECFSLNFSFFSMWASPALEFLICVKILKNNLHFPDFKTSLFCFFFKIFEKFNETKIFNFSPDFYFLSRQRKIKKSTGQFLGGSHQKVRHTHQKFTRSYHRSQ